MGRISLKEWAIREGLPLNEHGKVKRAPLMEILKEADSNAAYPALCSEGCEVEIDGRCPHGAPNLAAALGLCDPCD